METETQEPTNLLLDEVQGFDPQDRQCDHPG